MIDALWVRLAYLGVMGYPPSEWALDNWRRYHAQHGDWATFVRMTSVRP